MSIVTIVIIAILALSSIADIVLIGEPRKPITKGQAITGLIVNVLLIWWLVVSK